MSTDDGFQDDLRHRFDGALDGVQPSPDLYQRSQARIHRRSSSRLVAAVAAVAVVVAAGVVAVNALGPPSERLQVDPVAPPPADEPTAAPSDDPTDEAPEQPDEESDDQPDDASDAGEPLIVKGEPYSGPPIVEGGEMAVIGVDSDDVLNVRAAPGTDHPVVATLEPLADDFTATGEGRSLDGAIWVEVDTGDVTGWVHSSFIAHAAATEDITSQIIELHGSYPTAGSLNELAELVAGYRATQEPPSQVVVSDGPRPGDLEVVTIDVVGFGDDSVRAERLVVFGDLDSDGTFTLRSVEATTYCGRGVTDDELCL